MIAAVDLLVVGGLSVDRFPDGSEAPGGSVFHAARALSVEGLRGATITAAGPEAVAVAGVDTLRSFGPLLVHDAPSSIRFLIDERLSPRVVSYQSGAHLPLSPDDVAKFPSRAVLIAPIACELDPGAVIATSAVRVRVAALQGWLRILVMGEPVRARSLAGLGAELCRALGDMTALVVSDEDLAGAVPDADDAIGALRDWVGSGPVLLMTAGQAGASLELPGGVRVAVPAPLTVTGVSTLGAGDAFAALFAASLGGGMDPQAAARAAAAGVSRWLVARNIPVGT
jgi:sugar/nucleoside kinase (ribokinase family)